MAIDKKNLELLDKAAHLKQPVIFSADKVGIAFQTYVLKVESKFVVLENKVPPNYIRQVCDSEKFILQCQMVRFISETLGTDGKNILFTIKNLSVIEETRQTQRFAFEKDEQVICQLKNPFDQRTILSKPIIDMSSSGLSISSNYESKLFAPGICFDEIKVLIDGEPYSQLSGTVVYARKLLDVHGKTKIQVGFKINQNAS